MLSICGLFFIDDSQSSCERSYAGDSDEDFEDTLMENVKVT